jgi:hypothetical protein
MGCLVIIKLWPEAKAQSKGGALVGGVVGLLVILAATFM